jgi:hypothetical protein
MTNSSSRQVTITHWNSVRASQKTTRMNCITIGFTLIGFLMMNQSPLLIFFSHKISILILLIWATTTLEIKEDLILLTRKRFQIVNMKTNNSEGHHEFENPFLNSPRPKISCRPTKSCLTNQTNRFSHNQNLQHPTMQRGRTLRAPKEGTS